MKKIQTSTHEYLTGSKIRVSRTSGRLTNWKHTEHETLPVLTFEYAETDKKYSDQEDELFKFSREFWNLENKEDRTYLEQYEFDLRAGISELLEKLEQKFNKEFEKEIKNKFK